MGALDNRITSSLYMHIFSRMVLAIKDKFRSLTEKESYKPKSVSEQFNELR